MGAPWRIEFNSWGAEKRLAGSTSLALPPIYLTFPSPPPQRNTGSQAFISLLPDGECFVPPALPVICPAPRPGSTLKDYILGRDLNYNACPHAPSTRLIILVLWDENLELLFSSYHSHHLQVLSVDKCPISLHDWEQRGDRTTGSVRATKGNQKKFWELHYKKITL